MNKKINFFLKKTRQKKKIEVNFFKYLLVSKNFNSFKNFQNFQINMSANTKMPTFMKAMANVAAENKVSSKVIKAKMAAKAKRAKEVSKERALELSEEKKMLRS